jgi:flagellin-like hook-associated protein FlgL
MRQLAVLAMDDSKSAEDKLNLDQKYQALADALSKISGSAQYNGQPVLILYASAFRELEKSYANYYKDLLLWQFARYANDDNRMNVNNHPLSQGAYYAYADNKKFDTTNHLNNLNLNLSATVKIPDSWLESQENFVNGKWGDVVEKAKLNKQTNEVCQRVKVRLLAATGLQDKNSRYVPATGQPVEPNAPNPSGNQQSMIDDDKTIYTFCFEPLNDVTLGMKKYSPAETHKTQWRGTLITSFDTARVQANQAGNALKDIRRRIYAARAAQQELQLIKEANIAQYHNLIKTLERLREFAKNQFNRELCNLLKTISYLNA